MNEAWASDGEDDEEEEEAVMITAPSSDVTHNYSKLSKRLTETIAQMGVGLEL